MTKAKCPKGETARVGYYNRSGDRVFLLTEKQNGDRWFFLYEDQPDGTIKKLGRAKSPVELENKYDVSKKMFA
jgi:hypothetical protein